MCLFVGKLLSFLKKVCVSGPKGPQKNRPVMPESKAHFESNYSSYYNNYSLIGTSIVAIIVASRTY